MRCLVWWLLRGSRELRCARVIRRGEEVRVIIFVVPIFRIDCCWGLDGNFWGIRIGILESEVTARRVLYEDWIKSAAVSYRVSDDKDNEA